MNQRLQPHDPDERPDQVPPEAHRLGDLHRAGEDLLSAGQDAIRRALSGNSTGFLRANRQKGGQ